ncbi:hypothetical protein CNX65_22990 [Actinosynnema pretiosum]|uniref:Uncharacterized protein n=1 Tax=Actinosynnema pretiosum TaxID=42197 RepID=A0A290Z9T1_9PSEU|nr:hypothetical protein CNX65_22990 [Actinosynnema pretiosum]
MRELPEGETTLTRRLSLVTGFPAAERSPASRRLPALGSRPRPHREETESTPQDRPDTGQRAAPERRITRSPRLRLVTTSSKGDPLDGLSEVRDEPARQVTRAGSRSGVGGDRPLRLVPAPTEHDLPGSTSCGDAAGDTLKKP